jgi:hypothetical protein
MEEDCLPHGSLEEKRDYFYEKAPPQYPFNYESINGLIH